MYSTRYKTKKAAFAVILAVLFLLCPLKGAFPATEDDNKDAQEPSSFPVETGSVKAAALYHPNTESMLLSFNADTPLDVAGLTRMAPMLMVAEAIDRGEFSLEGNVVVSREAARVKGPTAFIEANETIKAEYLYKSAAMIGAGDAVYALAESAYGSMDAFLPAMNTRMSELGAFLEYSTPMGEGELLSAGSLALIGAELSKTKLYSAYSSLYMDEITHENGKTTELVNPNRLIRDLAGCTGLSTGSSNSAGYSGVFSASRGQDSFICVVIGAKNSAERFKVAESLLEYAFSTYKTLEIVKAGDVIIKDVPVSGSVCRSVDLVALDNCFVITTGGISKKEIKPDAEGVPELLKAPVSMGDTVCTLEYKDAEGNKVCEVKLGVSEDIPESGFRDYFSMIIMSWVGVPI